jgi:sulfate permease, SulP family
MMLQTVLSRTVRKSLDPVLELHFILIHLLELLPPPNPAHAEEPYNTLVKAFSSYADLDFDDLQPLISYLERLTLPEGHVLWRQGDEPDGLYVIEAGILRASYCFTGEAPVVEESMVPGTVAGELSALSGLPRNATAVVEKQCVLWKLSVDSMRRLEDENPVLARTFTQLVLKGSPLPLHAQDLSFHWSLFAPSGQDGLW